ncbi:hypothetical protein ACF3NR_08910 [Vaginella massiliensis]
MYKTNRWYLLFALLFSLVAPLFSITIAAETYNHALPPEMVAYLVDHAENVQQNETFFTWSSIAYSLYAIVALGFGLRFVGNIIKINQLIKTNPQVKKDQQVYVLLKDEVQPFSFLQYIFISKKTIKC